MVESEEEQKEGTVQLPNLQMEPANHNGGEEPASSSSHDVKEPGRLFEDGDDSESEVGLTLKDYEEAKLKELEIERRRIIENQVVRRRKIFRWPFHNQQSQKEGSKKQNAQSSSSIAGVLQSLKHYKKKKSPPAAKLHFIDTDTEMKLSPVVQESLAKHWESNRSEATETEPLDTSTDPDNQEEKQDNVEDITSDEKMSDQDLITFEGEEQKQKQQQEPKVNGDVTPGIEVTPPPEEDKEITEVPEVEEIVEKEEVAETETSVVSTASIDLNVADSPVVEETKEVSVEFEQLELSDKPVLNTPIANDIRSEMEPKFTKAVKRPNSNHAAESKIAMEIREMREREDELRKMRERLVLKADVQPEVSNESLASDGSTKSEDFLEDGRGSPNVEFHNKKNVTRAVSLDSLHGGQTYNVGYAFGHRRKDEIKVKPLDDGENANDQESKQRYRALKESPIEREIRLTREREDALRKEKGIVENKEDRRQLQKSIRNAKTPEPPIPHADTQRLLATSRIQQEIQEQTRREMALRESGHIQTISQERTDSKVTKMRESVNSPSQTNTIDRKRPTSPTVDIYEKTNGHSVNGNDKSPSPPTSSCSSTNVVPPGRRLSNPQVPGRGISMQRFIKSKGKDIGFAAFPSSYKENTATDYYEIRPPQLRRVNGHTGPIAPRRSVTAESKIQEELKEMKAREEELRKQRARLLGLSQPNLSLLATDDDLVTNGEQETNLDRSNSNPNLLDDHTNGTIDGADEQDIGFGSVKRRSNLIAQWEQRIQKAEAKS